MKRLLLGVILALCGCSASSVGTLRSVNLGTAPTHASVAAAGKRVYIIEEDAGGQPKVKALNLAGSLQWTRRTPCKRFHAVDAGLICVFTKGIKGWTAQEGKTLWQWSAPAPISFVRFEGTRLTIDLATGARHAFMTARGMPIAPDAKENDARKFTANGALTIQHTHRKEMIARRYGNGETLWQDLGMLWPRYQILPFNMGILTRGRRGQLGIGIVDPVRRTVQAWKAWPYASPPTHYYDSSDLLIAAGKDGFVALSQSLSTQGKSIAGSRFAASRSHVFELKRAGGQLILISHKLAPTPPLPPPPKTPIFLVDGAHFLGAFRKEDKSLVHLELKVRRWHPDIAYAWRSTGDWTTQRFAPLAAGDRGLARAFDGKQAFSPMPLWLSPSLIQTLRTTQKGQVGKIPFTLEGNSFHRLRVFRRKGGPETPVDVPVLMVRRTDTSERFWITPGGDRPMVLKAETKGGLFYIASVILPPAPSTVSH